MNRESIPPLARVLSGTAALCVIAAGFVLISSVTASRPQDRDFLGVFRLLGSGIAVLWMAKVLELLHKIACCSEGILRKQFLQRGWVEEPEEDDFKPVKPKRSAAHQRKLEEAARKTFGGKP